MNANAKGSVVEHAHGEKGMSDYIEKNLDRGGVDRRGSLKCRAWAGTRTLCVLQGAS